ncbi:hypothetical protein, partial [Pantoea sp. Morm]|uniref:hypothetical protein n=1 Tax=Pantoea sp. Morm TaxID=2601250 RepID=UPI0031FD03D7
YLQSNYPKRDNLMPAWCLTAAKKLNGIILIKGMICASVCFERRADVLTAHVNRDVFYGAIRKKLRI